MRKLECTVIKTTVKIKLASKEQATVREIVQRQEALSNNWEEELDKVSEGLYRGLDKYLTAVGITGDFTIDEPDFLFYDSDGRPLEG